MPTSCSPRCRNPTARRRCASRIRRRAGHLDRVVEHLRESRLERRWKELDSRLNSAPTLPSASLGPALGVSRNQGNGMVGPGGVQPVVYQAPITDGTGVLTAEWQQRRIRTETIDVPSGSAIRSAITSPQVWSATAEEYRPGPGPAGSAPGSGQNYAGRNYVPQNYAAQTMHCGITRRRTTGHRITRHRITRHRAIRRGTTRRRIIRRPRITRRPGYAPPGFAAGDSGCRSSGLQLRSGFVPGRQWPLGEPLARLSRDRAPSPPRPAESPSGPASPPGRRLPMQRRQGLRCSAIAELTCRGGGLTTVSSAKVKVVRTGGVAVVLLPLAPRPKPPCAVRRPSIAPMAIPPMPPMPMPPMPCRPCPADWPPAGLAWAAPTKFCWAA